MVALTVNKPRGIAGVKQGQTPEDCFRHSMAQ